MSELPQRRVVVEEVERRTQGEGIEPQADFRQFNSHRVEIDPHRCSA